MSHGTDSHRSSPNTGVVLWRLCARWENEQASFVVRVDRPAGCMKVPLWGGVAEVVKPGEEKNGELQVVAKQFLGADRWV